MIDRVVAIDPGRNGGIAWIDNDGKARAVAMPDTDDEIADLLERLSPANVRLEKVGGYIAGNAAPGSAMFNFGRNYGFLLGVLRALHDRVVLVTPQRWQKDLGLGHRAKDQSKSEWKRKLRDEAARRFPDLKITLKTADALLILETAFYWTPDADKDPGRRSAKK